MNTLLTSRDVELIYEYVKYKLQVREDRENEIDHVRLCFFSSSGHSMWSDEFFRCYERFLCRSRSTSHERWWNIN